MKFMLDMHDKVRHHFEKGGKFEKFWPLFDAQDTFMFTPATTTSSGPHVRDALDLKRVMITVVFALFPAILFGIWNAGHQHNLATDGAAQGIMPDILMGLRYVVPVIIVSYAVGGIWEVLFCIVRKHEINEGFLVTGMLFPLTLPPTIPLWQVAVGISFGVVIGKEIFGGTGMNVLNPALTARAFIFFAYPSQMSGDAVWVAMSGDAVQGFSGATALAIAAIAEPGVPLTDALTDAGLTFKNMFLGTIPGSIGETSTLACLIGAAILILTRIGSWQIMAGMLIGTLATAGLAGAMGTSVFAQLPPQYHLVMGGFAFGCVFMATDPVSSAATGIGKWIYGVLIGMLVVIIRLANPAYPEGVMLSILFMNVMAPMIDHYVLQAHIRKRKARYA
jgi:Na+-transporting NADH:ubiquinone oxidoreductase subunit B